MAKALCTGFHRIAHRAFPRPAESRERVTRYRHFSAARSGMAAGLDPPPVAGVEEAGADGPVLGNLWPLDFATARRCFAAWIAGRDGQGWASWSCSAVQLTPMAGGVGQMTLRS